MLYIQSIGPAYSTKSLNPRVWGKDENQFEIERPFPR